MGFRLANSDLGLMIQGLGLGFRVSLVVWPSCHLRDDMHPKQV